jgi:catechol 2,3-dioxygenase-like lactoylglutathione lyase family enzyme
MAYHHIGVAVKNVDRAHWFYTEAMGFKLVKVVKRKTPEGGWTKHIFYDCGDGEQFAIWDLRGIEGVLLNPEDWRGGISTGVGLPYFVNHISWNCKDYAGLELAKSRWLEHGYHVSEIEHEHITSIYTRDPDGNLVEFTFDTVPIGPEDHEEAVQLLADNTPATQEEYPAVMHMSPNYQARKAREKAEDEAAMATA